MRKATVFTIIICLFVLTPLTVNSQPPPPRKKVPVLKPDFALTAFAGDAKLSAVYKMIFIPEEQILTVSKTFPITCRFWDLSSGEEVRNFKLPRSAESEKVNFSLLDSFSFADKQYFAAPKMSSTFRSKSIRLWNMLTGEYIRDITSDRYHFNRFSFSPDGKFLASKSTEDHIDFWDPHIAQRLHGHSYTGLHESFSFSPDGKFFAIVHSPFGGHPANITVSNYTRKGLETICRVVPSPNEYDSCRIRQCVFSPDEDRIIALVKRSNGVKFKHPADIPENSKVTTIELWDLRGKLLRSLRLPIGQHANHIVLSPDGRMIAAPITGKMGAMTNTVQLWDTDTGKLIRTLSSPSGHISSVVFSPNGKGIVSTDAYSADQVPLWDAQTGKLIALLDNGVDIQSAVGISNIMFSPDGRFIAGTLRAVSLPIVWKSPSRVHETRAGRVNLRF